MSWRIFLTHTKGLAGQFHLINFIRRKGDFMIQFNFENVANSGNREPYNNVAAHEELKSMMSRFDRLNIFFDIDEDGYEVIKVESTYVKRFAYQLNDESANWLMTYLSTGKSEDFGVEPSEVQKSDQTNGNEYRKNMLKLFVESKAVNIQFTPEFRDRRGQLTAVANFKFGNIFFFVKRDEDIVSYLQEKELIR